MKNTNKKVAYTYDDSGNLITVTTNPKSKIRSGFMKKVLLILFITLMFVSTFVSCNNAPSVVNSEITKPIIETTPKTTVVLTTKKVETKTDKQTTKTVSHSTKAVTTNNKLQDLLKNVV